VDRERDYHPQGLTKNEKGSVLAIFQTGLLEVWGYVVLDTVNVDNEPGMDFFRGICLEELKKAGKQAHV
jgi:hypothetical protein